jgi:hypothetical protein
MTQLAKKIKCTKGKRSTIYTPQGWADNHTEFVKVEVRRAGTFLHYMQLTEMVYIFSVRKEPNVEVNACAIGARALHHSNINMYMYIYVHKRAGPSSAATCAAMKTSRAAHCKTYRV